MASRGYLLATAFFVSLSAAGLSIGWHVGQFIPSDYPPLSAKVWEQAVKRAEAGDVTVLPRKFYSGFLLPKPVQDGDVWIVWVTECSGLVFESEEAALLGAEEATRAMVAPLFE